MARWRQGARLAAPLAALLAVAACATAERYTFIALVGEAPGDKPLYTGFSPSARLGRPHPAFADASYRPPVLPDGPTGAAADAARAARQVLSDRASDFELRTRYLRLNAGEYQTAAAPLKPSVGLPLLPDTPRTQARIAAARETMARIQADVLSIYGIVQRSDQSKAQAERALAAVRAAGAGAATLAAPLTEGMANIDRMMRAGDLLVAAYVEWLGDQRTALDALEDEIRRGVATGPGILQRESIIE